MILNPYITLFYLVRNFKFSLKEPRVAVSEPECNTAATKVSYLLSEVNEVIKDHNLVLSCR